jgi:hypothetical protein
VATVTTRRAPSPEIRARDTPNDSAANGSTGVNSAPDVDTGANSAPDLSGQRCGDHEDRGDSTNYRKLAEHNLSPDTELPLGRVYQLVRVSEINTPMILRRSPKYLTSVLPASFNTLVPQTFG